MANAKFYLISWAVFISWSMSAQAQGAFAPVKGAKWTYVRGISDYTYLTGIYDNYRQSVKLSYTKDTTVRGRNYKLINVGNDRVGAVISPIINTTTGRVIGSDTAKYHYQTSASWMVRQSNDTVWSLVNADTFERVYFRFASRKDTIVLKKYPPEPGSRFDTGRVFIDSIGTFQIGAKSFKAWIGRSFYVGANDVVYYATSKLTFLDRVGPLNDLPFYVGFNNYGPYTVSNYPLGLVCYEDSEIGLVQFLNVDCNMPLLSPTRDLAINTLSSAIKTYFDGSTQKIMIESSNSDMSGWEASLVNLNGQILSRKTLNGTTNQMDLPARTPVGVYFIDVHNKTSGEQFAKKLLIY